MKTPNLDALAEEFQFLHEVEDVYRRLNWYRTNPNAMTNPFLDDYPGCGFLEEYERLKAHKMDLESMLYGPDSGTPYNPPSWVQTDSAKRLWSRAHEIMGFDDSE